MGGNNNCVMDNSNAGASARRILRAPGATATEMPEASLAPPPEALAVNTIVS